MTRTQTNLREFLAACGLLLVGLLLVAHCTGCGLWGKRAAAAVDTASYERDLDECLKEGRAARSLAVYETCAKEADRKHGVKDGGAP